MTKKRMMRNPELWIGRRIPSDIDADLWDYDVCDDCGRFYHMNDLNALLWPVTEMDWELQEALYVDEALAFCSDCLAKVEAKADGIDPEWRLRHR